MNDEIENGPISHSCKQVSGHHGSNDPMIPGDEARNTQNSVRNRDMCNKY